METEKLDIVYCVKDRPENEELRYSLRSLKNLAHSKVWIYGGCPKWVNENELNIVPIPQNLGNKWLNTASLLKAICENDNITENFIWFNDDFFVLRPQEKLDYYKDRNLLARAYDFTKLGWWQFNGAYPSRLKVASRELKLRGCENENYELHLPIIFNRQKLLEVCRQFGGVGAKRSLYGNFYEVHGKQRSDVKIYDLKNKPGRNWDYVSTSDESFVGGEVGKYIRRKFNKQCKYEKEDEWTMESVKSKNSNTRHR